MPAVGRFCAVRRAGSKRPRGQHPIEVDTPLCVNAARARHGAPKHDLGTGRAPHRWSIAGSNVVPTVPFHQVKPLRAQAVGGLVARLRRACPLPQPRATLTARVDPRPPPPRVMWVVRAPRGGSSSTRQNQRGGGAVSTLRTVRVGYNIAPACAFPPTQKYRFPSISRHLFLLIYQTTLDAVRHERRCTVEVAARSNLIGGKGAGQR